MKIKTVRHKQKQIPAEYSSPYVKMMKVMGRKEASKFLTPAQIAYIFDGDKNALD